MSNEEKTDRMQEIRIDPFYPGYVFLGWASGMFETDNGRKRSYYNMYVLSPVSGYSSEDYRASGFKAEKKKCVSDSVWEGFQPGDRVKLYFDDKGRVQDAVLDV